MKKFMNVVGKLAGIIPAVALMMGNATVSQACILWFHQPEIPEEMKR